VTAPQSLGIKHSPYGWAKDVVVVFDPEEKYGKA